MKEKLYIFDTTLRDGAQTYGVDFNVDEKKLLAKKLDELGVDYIEGGWPGANSTDTKFFNEDLKFKKIFPSPPGCGVGLLLRWFFFCWFSF